MKIYKFRNCFLNTLERRVIRDGKYIDLTPKTFDVLQLLVERSGEIVSKDEMLGKVWDGSFVEEGNLPVHITKLRRLLDEADARRFIETVQGTGYRFIAPMESVSSEAWRKQLSGSGRRRTDKSPAGLALDSIAVLPLRNESDNPEIDYLADGLTESFINSLSRIPDLKVIARDTVFRYKNKDADAKEVGETLGTSAVLTGRITVLKKRLMISVELIKVEDGSQLWGTQFNQPFSDIIKIQEEITSAVSEKLQSEISHVVTASHTNPVTQNAESYRLYLKGKYFAAQRTVEDLNKAIECFEKSVSYDPVNVHSYVEIAQGYRLIYVHDHISYKEILSKVKPILSVLDTLPQSIDVLQVLYANLKVALDWNFVESEECFRRALAINPNCLIAHIHYSQLLIVLSRFSEALEHLQQVMIIDPFSFSTDIQLGRLFFGMGRNEMAISYLNDALDLEPANYEALVLLGIVLAEIGNYDEALAVFHKSLSVHDYLESRAMIGYIHALEGNRNKARQIIGRIESGISNHLLKIARIYVALGEWTPLMITLRKPLIDMNLSFSR